MSPAIRRDLFGRRPARPETDSKDSSSVPREGERLERVLRERYELTRSEAEVARHIAEGLGYSEVAELLGVSYHTVHSHVKAIHSKTGFRSTGKLSALIRDLRP